MRNATLPLIARNIVVTGRVQGVGYRPFVYRLAHRHGIAGTVCNRGGIVDIHAEGEAAALDAFERALVDQAPPLAAPNRPSIEPAPVMGCASFVISRSTDGSSALAHLPPDHFVCDDCLAEMADPAARRYRYPFINCTQCGPRYTLIDRLPYDRPNTSMRDFGMCPDCLAEYSDPLDRRYHAQPLACPACGPSLSFHAPEDGARTGNEAALSACIDHVRQGAIVAVKGVGGYHLLCDARDEATVERLRDRKHRPAKPLAVMVPWRGPDGLDVARTCAVLTAEEEALLTSPLRPIVLGRRRDRGPLAESIAPGLVEIGLMLPYSPLHHLLADDYGAPLVATSANISGEPVLTDAEEVEARLRTVADAFLHHDRPILRPADDSVYRSIAGRVRPLRLGRGSAPIERELAEPLPFPVLAAGADLKNTLALGFGRRVVISPHIGDLGSVRSFDVFSRISADLQDLYGVRAARIVCDAHPDYRSSRWARAAKLPVDTVLHHHAHASALAGEYHLEGPGLVFAWDGTGYGEDGSIWGGEALLGRPGNWRRVGSLRPFRLPGGERAVYEPWRIAAALCWEAGLDWPGCPRDTHLLRQAWERGLHCPPTTSIGRLFDGAAALLGLAEVCTYEGEAAMRLEARARGPGEAPELPLVESADLLTIDWSPLLPMLQDTGRSIDERAHAFHASLADALSRQVEEIGRSHGFDYVGLCGGVFQNRILSELVAARLRQRGLRVYLADSLPTNDAAISFGQIIEAAARLS
ncbi:MAG: carbamoyltransferase HypF [Methylotetracoccus sp.]